MNLMRKYFNMILMSLRCAFQDLSSQDKTAIRDRMDKSVRDQNREAKEWQEQKKQERTTAIRAFIERRNKVLAEETPKSVMTIDLSRQKSRRQGKAMFHL